MNNQYLQNRQNLIEKVSKDENYKPTKEELQNAYGYLDFCLDCGKRILPLEPFSHSMLGNRHRFGCSFFRRFVGFIYKISVLPLELIFFIIIAPIYFGVMGIKKLLGETQGE